MFLKKNLIAAAALVAFAGAATTAAAAGSPVTSTFQVQMTVSKTCNVTAGNTINLGSTVATTSATISGNNTFKVNCSKTTPFFIGLAPSNGNTSGVGAMKGTGTNTDTVAYTLYSNAGLSTVWGNNGVNSTSAGTNGVTGTGTGMNATNSITETVYASVTAADVTPDNYSDTVTVNVNF